MATLGDKAVGDIVKLNENGSAVEYIVMHQGLPSSDYDSSCEGTWLLRKSPLQSYKVFDTTNADYLNSDMHSYLNSTILQNFDRNIQECIKEAKIPYIDGSYNLCIGSIGLPTKVFLLSAKEVFGDDVSYANSADGAVLDYFNGVDDSVRIAYLPSRAVGWWLRTPAKSIHTFLSDLYVEGVSDSGGRSNISVTSVSIYVRPTIILPYELTVDNNGMVKVGGSINGTVTIGGAAKELVGGYVNIGGTWKEIVKQYTNVGGVWKE